jgi:hypothetical protein
MVQMGEMLQWSRWAKCFEIQYETHLIIKQPACAVVARRAGAGDDCGLIKCRAGGASPSRECILLANAASVCCCTRKYSSVTFFQSSSAAEEDWTNAMTPAAAGGPSARQHLLKGNRKNTLEIGRLRPYTVNSLETLLTVLQHSRRGRRLLAHPSELFRTSFSNGVINNNLGSDRYLCPADPLARERTAPFGGEKLLTTAGLQLEDNQGSSLCPCARGNQ